MAQPNSSNQSRSEPSSLHYICLMTCDKAAYWVEGRSFTRKLVPEHMNLNPVLAFDTDVPWDVPFNDAPTSKTHLCFLVHEHSRDTHPRKCILNPGSPVVQVPATEGSRRGNVFNSLYWWRCDETITNALGEVLNSEGESGGAATSSFSQTLPMVRLRDVIEPKLDKVSEKDLARFEMWKDAFVQRWM